MTYRIFDLAGHTVASGQLNAFGNFDIASTGCGVRVCEIISGATAAEQYKIICP